MRYSLLVTDGLTFPWAVEKATGLPETWARRRRASASVALAWLRACDLRTAAPAAAAAAAAAAVAPVLAVPVVDFFYPRNATRVWDREGGNMKYENARNKGSRRGDRWFGQINRTGRKRRLEKRRSEQGKRNNSPLNQGREVGV